MICVQTLMIEDPPILKIKQTRNRPSQAQIDAFKGVPTGFVVDAMYGRGALAKDIYPLAGLPHGKAEGEGGSVAGPALTADNGPADILASLAALHYLQPGDVLVAAFDGHQGCAAAGDRLCGMVQNAGGIAFITDGPVRDLAGLQEVGLPLWATGLTPASPFSSGPGVVGFPVQIGGQHIASGDMIVADSDGVVVVPFAEIDAVIDRLKVIQRLERERDQQVADGLTVPQNVLEILHSKRTLLTDD